MAIAIAENLRCPGPGVGKEFSRTTAIYGRADNIFHPALVYSVAVKTLHAKGFTMTTTHIDKELDVKGLNCPLPILRAKKALSDMESGQLLRIVATDPGTVKDFVAFCRQTGNPLRSSSETPTEFTFLIEKR
jgi:tRNA 2-thiouridine synthesizing protein A